MIAGSWPVPVQGGISVPSGRSRDDPRDQMKVNVAPIFQKVPKVS